MALSSVTVRNNRTLGQDALGGGIYVAGAPVTLTGGTIENNLANGFAGFGGGLAAVNASVVMDQMAVSDNTASFGGGGIYLDESEINLVDSLIDNNQIGSSGFGSGGGVLAVGSSQARLRQVQIQNNRAVEGGGIKVHGGELSIQRALIRSNVSNNSGGGAGVHVRDAELLIEDSALIENQASGSANAGGLYMENATGEIINSTFSGNVFGFRGAAINLFGSSELVLIHTTVAMNGPNSSEAIFLHTGSALSMINSLVVGNGCGSFGNVTLINQNTLSSAAGCGTQITPEAEINLLPLTSLDDFRAHHPLGAGSVAINAAGNCIAEFGVDRDQRGEVRPGGGSAFCDAGAYESQATATNELSVSPTALQFGSVPVGEKGETKLLTLTNTGQASVDISAITRAGSNPGDFLFRFVGGSCIGPLLPGESCAVRLSFEPADVGVRTAAIQINSSAPNSPQSVSLSGTGTLNEPGEDRIFSDRFQSNGH